jgi:hypothetical protein
MKLTDQLAEYVNAAFTGLWIQTHEADEAERDIVQHARQKKWKIAVWDMAGGLRIPGAGDQQRENATVDPLSALRSLPALADPTGTALLLVHNFHRFLNNPEVVQTVFSQLIAGKQQRTFLVVLSPVVQIPVELEKLFVVLEHAFPDRQELARIASELTSDQPGDSPTGEQLQRVLDAAAGLTRYEAEGAFALSLSRHNTIRPETIWELKAQTLRKNNLLTLHRGQENFESLGGLGNLKDFCRRALRPGRTVKPRGVLLLGVARSVGSDRGCCRLTSSNAQSRQAERLTSMVPAGADPAIDTCWTSLKRSRRAMQTCAVRALAALLKTMPEADLQGQRQRCARVPRQ